MQFPTELMNQLEEAKNANVLEMVIISDFAVVISFIADYHSIKLVQLLDYFQTAYPTMGLSAFSNTEYTPPGYLRHTITLRTF